MMSLQTRGTAMLFLNSFSCHVINGPDYSNEHMNLKTTSQKWCIYISNEINRREREIVLIETLQTRWCSPERSRAIHED